MYVFSLTVFSTGQQIQAICMSPETDAIHLKLPLCPTSSLKSDFELDKGAVNASAHCAEEENWYCHLWEL